MFMFKLNINIEQPFNTKQNIQCLGRIIQKLISN